MRRLPELRATKNEWIRATWPPPQPAACMSVHWAQYWSGMGPSVARRQPHASCSTHHSRSWPQCVYRGRVQADLVCPWSSLPVFPRLHRQLIYTYGSSPHNLTTFHFRLWLPSAPASPPEASTAIFSSAFLPSRRSLLLPPVPLLHYYYFFFFRVCARTTLPPLRLG